MAMMVTLSDDADPVPADLLVAEQRGPMQRIEHPALPIPLIRLHRSIRHAIPGSSASPISSLQRPISNPGVAMPLSGCSRADGRQRLAKLARAREGLALRQVRRLAPGIAARPAPPAGRWRSLRSAKVAAGRCTAGKGRASRRPRHGRRAGRKREDAMTQARCRPTTRLRAAPSSRERASGSAPGWYPASPPPAQAQTTGAGTPARATARSGAPNTGPGKATFRSISGASASARRSRASRRCRSCSWCTAPRTPRARHTISPCRARANIRS